MKTMIINIISKRMEFVKSNLKIKSKKPAIKHKFDYIKIVFQKFFYLKIKFCFAFRNVPNLSSSEITNFGIVGQDHSLKSAPKSSPSSIVCGRWMLSVSGRNTEVKAPATLSDPITIRGKTLE